MPRSKDVTLAGVTYRIEQLPMRANKEWRDNLGAPVMGLINLIQGFGNLELKTEDILKIVGVVKDLLLNSMDTLLNALFSYSPVLETDRERIETEAYDDEAIAALGVVVGLAYPLDQVLTGPIRGLVGIPTSTRSPLPSGANGTNKPTAGRHRATTKT